MAGALGFWVAGFWVAEDGWHHRRALWLVFPFVLLGADQIARAVAGARWLWLVALLLGWQSLSRVWADPLVVEPFQSFYETLFHAFSKTLDLLSLVNDYCEFVKLN